MDNIREALRILILLSVVMFARRLGFYEVLAGLALADMLGMFFMIHAVAKTFHVFRPAALLWDAFKVSAATTGIILVGVAVSYVPIPITGSRLTAAFHAATVFTACIVALWPALLLSKFITSAERKTLLSLLFPRRAVGSGIQKEASA